MERGLPSPSAALAIIGAALVEFESIEPGFLLRLQRRLQSESLRTAVVQLRGPKLSIETITAVEEAHAWIGAACLVTEAVRAKKKRRA